ncbi:PREDICTED: ribonuclease pancreatic-like [Condylura cristata]|uniref:ribonuclease pancreatic-like n=1 Tax=Condylura cristata TaxID=143302 RepID=UPI000642B016|nr:PREDICTED: ribonuclease pancreatic-like [Condylura cristata]
MVIPGGPQGIEATMALKTLVLFSLLVLGLLVIVGAQPPAFKRFQERHMDTGPGPFDPPYCNKTMYQRNLLKRNFNTFVHESLKDVHDVCWEENYIFKNRTCNNCHKSSNRMSITECSIIGRNPIRYRTKNSKKYIVIACDGIWPVHFDGSE